MSCSASRWIARAGALGVQALILATASIPAAAPDSEEPLPGLARRWECSDETDDLLLGEIVDAVGDPAGNTYLLDYRLQQVVVVDPDGNFLRALGRPGDGPGETRAASRLFLDQAGRVGLLDMVASRVTWFNPDGTPSTAVKLRFNADGSGALGIYDARIWSEGYVAAFMQRSPRGGPPGLQVVLARLGADGIAEDILLTVPDLAASRRADVIDERDLYNFVWNCWDVDTQGRVYCAPNRDDHRLTVIETDGSASHLAATTFVRPQRTQQELERVRRLHAEAGGSQAGFKVATTDPAFQHVWCDDQDRLWVSSSDSASRSPNAARVRYDVYSPAGDRLATVGFGPAVDPRFDHWFLVSSSLLIVVENALTGGFEPDDAANPRGGDLSMKVSCYAFELPPASDGRSDY